MSQRGCHRRREASRAGDLRRAHQNRRHAKANTWFHRRERRRICGFVHTSGFMPFLRGQNVVCFDKNLMFFKDSYDSFHSMCAVKLNSSLPLFFLTSAQIRAARSLIRWTAEDLASASALSVATIRRAELKKNQTALTSANDLAIAARWSQPGWSSSTRTAGARVSGCGSGSRKQARAGSKLQTQAFVTMVTAGRTGRWSRHDVFTTVRLFSQCLNVPSLFGLDGVKQLIIVEGTDFKLTLSRYLKGRDSFNNYVSL